MLSHVGRCWVHFGAVLGPSSAHFGTIVGPFWGHLGTSWGQFWARRCRFGASLKPKEARRKGCPEVPAHFGPKMLPGRPFLTPKMAPKSAQGHPRGPKRHRTRREINENTKNLKFARRLGGSTIFEGPGPPKGPKSVQLGPRKAPKSIKRGKKKEHRKRM